MNANDDSIKASKQPMTANKYAQRIPHSPNSNALAEEPQTCRTSCELHPAGYVSTPRIKNKAGIKKRFVINACI